MSRRYMHFPEAGVSLGIDVVSDGDEENPQPYQARVSVAIVNRDEGDRFSRPAARTLLNARLDGETQTLRAFRVNQHLFTVPYDGDKSVNDVLRPLANRLREQLERRKEGRGNAESIIRILAHECALRRRQGQISYATVASAEDD